MCVMYKKSKIKVVEFLFKKIRGKVKYRNNSSKFSRVKEIIKTFKN